MNELVDIFDDTAETLKDVCKGLAKILCFPIRLCYWCCKEFLKFVGVIE